MIAIIVMIIFILYDHCDQFGYHDHNDDNQECKHIAGDVERHEKHMKESRHVHTFRSKAYRCEVRNNGNNDGGDVVVGRLLDWSCDKEPSHFNLTFSEPKKRDMWLKIWFSALEAVEGEV